MTDIRRLPAGRKIILWVQMTAVLLMLAACGNTSDPQGSAGAGASTEAGAGSDTLIYGSGDYTRINPAMDEHGEINILIFNGLTAHNGENEVVPSLAES